LASIPSVLNIDRLKFLFVASSDIIVHRMISDLLLWDTIYVKFIQEGTVYKSKTRLKNRSNRPFERVGIPPHVPFEFSKMWLIMLSDYILHAVDSGPCEEIVDPKGRMLALESIEEARSPIYIMTVISQVEHRTPPFDFLKLI